jgi:hypothetical protein
MCSASVTMAPLDDLKSLYDRRGYVGPFAAFERRELERTGIVSVVGSLDKVPGWARNRHLDIPAIAEICRNESVISCVRKVLGPNLLMWRSNIFAISSGGKGLRWHQDIYRTLLDSPPGAANCSAQINFTDSTKLNTVSIIPGSHRWTDDELRERGYRMEPGSDRDAYGAPRWDVASGEEVLDVPMMAGEFFVFHPRLLHASADARWFRGAASELSLILRLRRRLLSKYANWSGKRSVRYSITLRIATVDTKVLPAAFVEVPARATAVLLAGTDTAGINRLGAWAT